MGRIQIFFRYTVLNFILFLKTLFLYPFSRLARHQASNAYLNLRYPFFGDRYVELADLLKEDNLQVTLAPVKARIHNASEFELLSICALIKDRLCNTIFEIGTFDGRTTRAMAMNLANEEGKVYTINLPPGSEEVRLETNKVDVNLASKVASGERFLHTAQEKYIQQLWGDSASFDFTPFYGKIDLVFIDGAHSEPYAKNDTSIAMKLVKDAGGVIIWHDAHLFGVVKFLKQWIRDNDLPVYFIKGTSLAVAGIRNGAIGDLKNIGAKL